MRSLVNIALLKEQLKRYWAIAVLALVGYILSIVLPLYHMDYSNDAAGILGLLFGMRHPTIIIASLLIPLVTVLATFSYLFQPKATTAIHAYPISKNQLMATNMLAGFILMAVPLLILSVCLLSPIAWTAKEPFTDSAGVVYYYSVANLPMNLYPNGIHSGAIINTFPIVAGFFFRTICTFAFYYTIFLTAAMIVGNSVVYILVSVILPFIHIGLYMLFPLAATYYSFGYESFNIDSALVNLFMFTQPLSLAVKFDYYDPASFIASEAVFEPMWQYVITYIIIVVILLCISVLCNHKRRQERAGDSFVFTPVKNVLIFLLSMLAMILMGVLFIYWFSSVIAMYIGFAVGFCLAYFISQMIAEKTLNIIFKAKGLLKFGGIMVGMFLVIIAITRLDLTGYVRYVPEADKIDGVYIGAPYEYFNGSIPEKYKSSVFVKDGETISTIVAAHKEIVSDRGKLRKIFTDNIVGKYYNSDNTRQYIMYRLKSGKLVLRSYLLPKSLLEDYGLSTVLDSDEVIMSQYFSFKNLSDIESLELNYTLEIATESIPGYTRDEYTKDDEYTYHGRSINIDTPENIASLLQAVTKDILISERFSDEEAEQAHTLNTPKPQQSITNISGCVELKDVRYSVNYFYLVSTENTVAWLKSQGYME